MSEPSASHTAIRAAEDALCDELARGEARLRSAGGALRGRLDKGDEWPMADDVLARVRAMIADIAGQMFGGDDAAVEEFAAFERELWDIPALLRHLHALAVEWRLTCRMQEELGIDPVRPPLLERLLESDRPAQAALSVRLLRAQARFCQTQRQMLLPIEELPSDLLRAALRVSRGNGGDGFSNAPDGSFDAEREDHWSRIDLIERVLGEVDDLEQVLAVDRAGVAIFVSGLAVASGRERDLAVLSTEPSQRARLLLTLRASGLSESVALQQFVRVHPSAAVPPVTGITSDQAAAILASSSRRVEA